MKRSACDILIPVLIAAAFLVSGFLLPARAQATDLSPNTGYSAAVQPTAESGARLLEAYAAITDMSRDRLDRLANILVDVETSGIPLEPFLWKIQEGTAKGVSPGILETVLSRQFTRYRFVRQLVESSRVRPESCSGAVLTALIDSLDFGLRSEELEALAAAAPDASPRELAVAAQNKALLRQLGFDENRVDAILSIGLTHRSFTSRWTLFFKVADAARTKGIPEERILGAAESILVQRGDVRDVLDALGFTRRDTIRGPVPSSEVN